MPVDIPRLIGAVTRELTTRDVDGEPARVIVATRTYNTSADDLWDAITSPERLPRWFSPVTGDFRLGGRYQIEGNASGEIRECEPPSRLGLTWEWQEQVSWVNVDLVQEREGVTRLRLEHVAHVPGDFWDRYGAGAAGGGWDLALLGLHMHLSGDTSVTPETAMEWLGSPEGKSYVTESSNAWCASAIAAGEDPDAARAAARRNIAAYTGEPEEGSGES